MFSGLPSRATGSSLCARAGVAGMQTASAASATVRRAAERSKRVTFLVRAERGGPHQGTRGPGPGCAHRVSPSAACQRPRRLPPLPRPFGARAKYFWPFLTVTVFFFTKSRTLTVPCLTEVVVPAQVSLVSHWVPRTVAELFRPRVRKRPLPLPNRLRLRLRATAIFLVPPFGTFVLHLPRGVRGMSCVSGLLPD